MGKYKIIYLIILLIISSLNCKSQVKDDENCVKFKLDTPNTIALKETKFKFTDYQLDLKSVYVMEGSNTGMEIEFQQKENDKNTLSLFFSLPSGNTFKVYTKNPGFEYKLPEIPCTITNDDFQNILSARAHQTLYAYIYINRNIRLAPDHSSVESVYFEIFSISIKEFDIQNDKINFSCSFTGSMSENQIKVQDANYKIYGELNIKDFPVSVMMVDD